MLQAAPLAHITTFLSAIVKRRFFNPRPVSCAEPAALSKEDAAAIGESVKAVRLGHNMPSKAADELLRTYPALTQMDEAHPWFRPFVHEVVVEKMRISKLTIVRLALALSLSFFDIITDLLTVSAYWGGNLQNTAHTILALVCLSLLFQSFATFMRYRHLGAKQVAREVLIPNRVFAVKAIWPMNLFIPT